MLLGYVASFVAIIAVIAAIRVMLWGMGYKEYLGGKKKSEMPAVGKEELKEKILGLNYPDSPYQVQASKETDFILDWKIVDAKWYGIFSK